MYGSHRHRLGPRPAWRQVAEQLPRHLVQRLGLAVARAQQEDDHVVRQLVDHDAGREGDALAVAIVGRAIYKLGAALAGLLHLFDPEIVILGGQVADAGVDLLLPLQEEVWGRSRGLLGRDVPIVEQQVADKSGIIGAAGLVMAPRA